MRLSLIKIVPILPIWLFCLIVWTNPVFGENELLFESTDKQKALIELFTSESNANCLNADAWLSSLLDHPDLWEKIVPVALHVDYLDKKGWKDRFGSSAVTERQHEYAKYWKVEAFAPTVMVNGTEWNRWSHRAEPIWREATVGKMEVEKTSNKAQEFEIRFTPASKLPKGYIAHISLLGFGVKSLIKDGENRGQMMDHQFISLVYKQKAMEKIAVGYRAKFQIPTPVGVGRPRFGLATWITQENSPLPIQAAGNLIEVQ